MITLKDDNSVFHSAFKIYRSLTIHKDGCHKFSHMEGILRNGEAWLTFRPREPDNI